MSRNIKHLLQKLTKKKHSFKSDYLPNSFKLKKPQIFFGFPSVAIVYFPFLSYLLYEKTIQ